MDKVVVKARVVPSRFPDRLEAEVLVVLEGEQEERVLFRFFDDEINFAAEEFIGHTMEQGLDLRLKRDVAYLQS